MAPGTEKVVPPPIPPKTVPNNDVGCMKCGRGVSESDAFCIYCGTRVSDSLAAAVKKPTQPEDAPPLPPPSKSAAQRKSPPPPAPTAEQSNAPSTGEQGSAIARSSSGMSSSSVKNEQQVSRPPLANSSSSISSSTTSSAPPQTGHPTTVPPAHSRPPRTTASPPPLPPRDDSSRQSMDQIDVSELENLWVPDNFSADCMDCHIPFKFGKRRHHCRLCGLLFCRECVRFKTQIPASFGYGVVPQRCCRNCVTSLQMKAITTPADVFAQRRQSKKTTGIQSATSSLNPYQVLGLSLDSSPEEITRQYHHLLSSPLNEDAEQLQQIKEAYQMLQDPVRRRQEDLVRASLASGGGDSTPDSFENNARSDQPECQICFRPFKLGRRQHHCRRCTRSVCTTCSEGQKPIVELGFPQPVRHCTTCMESPPAFIYPTMTSHGNPPPGFEYLNQVDIRVSVGLHTDSSAPSQVNEEEGTFQVKTYCEPNASSLSHALTVSDRQVAQEYGITRTRTYMDFEWLVMIMSQSFNTKGLPSFPDKRQVRGKEGVVALETFLYGCMIHPLLRHVEGLKAFLVLPTDTFLSFKRLDESEMKAFFSPSHRTLVSCLRVEFEKAQIRKKIEQLMEREKAHLERMQQQKVRSAAHEKREAAQKIRREQATTRFQALTARQTSQTERMKREQDRYDQQLKTTHVLYFNTVADQAVRKTEEEVRLKEKGEFLKSKDAFQADTTEWNRDMALWSSHRANWSEAHNPPISKDIASEWMMQSYGLYSQKKDKEDDDEEEEIPKDLIDLHAQLQKMQAKEPVFLEHEGHCVDEEWMKLAQERENWTTDRANMKREDEMCSDEDVRYEQEHTIVRLATAARVKKVEAIESDLAALKTEITSRTHCLTQRRQRHEALEQEFEKEWKTIQSERLETTQGRIAAHKERIQRCQKRIEVFRDQLTRQESSERMLLFKRAFVTEERKTDTNVFESHREDCQTVLEAARASRVLTPEYIARMEADHKICVMEHQRVNGSNQRTVYEGEEKKDEEDEFMKDVSQRRHQFQLELNDQLDQLEKEKKRCTSLIEGMEVFLLELDKEMECATQEEALINEYKTLLASELDLLQQEEKKREEKKNLMTGLINTSGNWVLDALHDHSKRKKKEADRLVSQAVRAAALQTLVQHFTHRVIEQEERIMRQKQRILNGEHTIEMLKSSEHWFQYVMSYRSDLTTKDLKLLETCITQRKADIKEASRLEKEDAQDLQSVVVELGKSRRVTQEQAEKRLIWNQIEEAYRVTKPQEKDEDMMMTSQIRSLLQQLGEAFEMLTNRLMEEDESLQHASTQLEGEMESINAFMQRMESEENTLCTTEKMSLTKEQQVRRTESDLIEQRARSLIETYRQMQTEHGTYDTDLEKILQRRQERERPLISREGEMEMAKKLIKTRNYYDRKACGEFAKKFKIDHEMKTVRDVFEWLKNGLDRDIKKMEKWMEASRKERKQMEAIHVKATEIDWTKDTLARIPALQEVLKKLSRSQSSSSVQERSSEVSASASTGIHPSEQWIVDLITLKKNISEMDAVVIEHAKLAIENATGDETNMNGTLQTLKTDREYVLNSIRFIDQEEANAVRGIPRTISRRLENPSECETKEATPSTNAPSPPKPNKPVSPRANSRAPSSSRRPHPSPVPNAVPQEERPTVARATSTQNATRPKVFAKPQSADV